MVRDEAFTGLLAAGGKMGALIGGFDWSSSPLGPVQNWPQSLRSSLSICLSSKFPMFVFWGPDLVQLYNDSFVPVLGAKHPEALGRAARDTWAETWDVVGPMLSQVLASGEAAYFEDLMVILERSGFAEECYFTFCYSPVHDESGRVAGVFGTVSETTSQVVGARRLGVLSELSERTRTLGSVAEVCQVAGEVLAGHAVEVPFALLYLLEPDGGLATLAGCSGLAPGTALSPSLVALSGAGQGGAGQAGGAFSWPLTQACAGPVEVTGLDTELLAAMRRGGFAPPSSAILTPIALAGERGPGGLMIAGLGSGRPLDASYRTFVRLAAGHLSAAFADATALEAARDRAAQLAELDRAKTAFFSNVSHELRTPLTLMLAPLEDLLSGRDGLRPADQDRAELAYRNAVRLLSHVNTLLDFSRAADADAKPQAEPLDLAGVTAELAGLFKIVVERGGLRLNLDCPPLPQPVWADRGMWEQVVLNLLSNAFKFTLQGEITVSVDTADGQARVRVRDTGIGIAASALPRLFDRFYQVEQAQGRSGEGSGIGLSLARELVQRHGGTISVTSVAGSGTTFTVLLPFGQASPGALVPVASHAASPRAGQYVQEVLSWTADSADALAGEPPEVLIVDDNADMRSYLTSALSPHWRVRAVGDGVAALQAISQQQPELVLTDVMMPRLDGFALLDRLRSDATTRDIPVIMISARAGSEALVSGLNVGADDYLVKPFTTAELTARIRTHLRISRQRRQAAARIQVLADATREFNASLDQQQISHALTRYLVPGYAASCLVQLSDRPDADQTQIPGQLAVALVSRGKVIGTMTLTGLTDTAHDPEEQAFLAELASRAAPALDNASRYQHDHSTALHLQSAMLTEVLAIPGTESAALYQPAVTRDLVGGDWYDSFPIPAAADGSGPGTSLAIVIGDVTGHDVHAATLMGQVRSMLRQAVLDHLPLGPHAAVSALEEACATLVVGATGTLILGRLDREAGDWTLTWTNAGHPGPLVCHPDGTVHSLDQHDFMFYPGLSISPDPRNQHQVRLAPGSTILLYTDGLVDRPGGDYDRDVEHAGQILAAHRDLPLSQLLDALVAEIAGPNHTDDIALLAVRVE